MSWTKGAERPAPNAPAKAERVLSFALPRDSASRDILPAAAWGLAVGVLAYTRHYYGYGYGYGYEFGPFDPYWMTHPLFVGLAVAIGSLVVRRAIARMTVGASGSRLRLHARGLEWSVGDEVVLAWPWSEVRAIRTPLMSTKKTGRRQYRSVMTGTAIALEARGQQIVVWHGTTPPSALERLPMRATTVGAFDGLRQSLSENGVELEEGTIRFHGLFAHLEPGPWGKFSFVGLLVFAGLVVTGFLYSLNGLAPLLTLGLTVALAMRAWAPFRRWQALRPAMRGGVLREVVGGDAGRLELRGDPSFIDLDAVVCPDAFVHERTGAKVRVVVAGGGTERGPYRGSGIASASFIEPDALTRLRVQWHNGAGAVAAARLVFAGAMAVTYLRSFWYAFAF